MKRSFFALLALGVLWCAGAGVTTAVARNASAPEIYEWRIYTLAKDAEGAVEGANAALFDDFLRNRLIPAYNRQGIEVGVFEPAAEYTEFPAGARCVFMVWPDLETFQLVNGRVREDAEFVAGAAGYFNASAPRPVYTAQETYLFEQLAGASAMKRPGDERGLLEFRIYRSPNMEANERKIKMFEQGEIAVFDATGINGVFYGRTLAGGRMPSLAYLTWYTDAEARTKAWDDFGVHPEWVRMRGLPEYANTATDNTIRLLNPMPWSQY